MSEVLTFGNEKTTEINLETFNHGFTDDLLHFCSLANFSLGPPYRKGCSVGKKVLDVARGQTKEKCKITKCFCFSFVLPLFTYCVSV